jgi:hypothetical protein
VHQIGIIDSDSSGCSQAAQVIIKRKGTRIDFCPHLQQRERRKPSGEQVSASWK